MRVVNSATYLFRAIGEYDALQMRDAGTPSLLLVEGLLCLTTSIC